MSEIEKSSLTSAQRKDKYRDLLDQVEILDENKKSGLRTAEVLDDILENANILFTDSKVEHVKYTDEVLLDAKVVATASSVLLNATEAIDCTLDVYEHIEFGRHINSQLLSNDDSDSDYTKLIEIAKNVLKCPPKLSFMYGELGSIDPNVQETLKTSKQRSQKTRKLEQTEKKEPERVTKINKEEDSVDDTVKFLQWALNKEFEENGEKELIYFNFIVNPASYSATIENMFHFSFLIRDGRAKIDIDSSGNIVIIPASGQDAKRARKNGTAYKQSIISIDMDEWQTILNNFKIKNYCLSKWKNKWDSRKDSL